MTTAALAALACGVLLLAWLDRRRTRRLVRRHLRAAQECEDMLRLASILRLSDARIDAWTARADRERIAAWNLRRNVR